MALDKIILVSNPGSESRKYSLYRGEKCLAKLHFERINERVVCTVMGETVQVNISHIAFAPTVLLDVMQQLHPEIDGSQIEGVALRIVAPSTYFQQNHVLSQKVIERLEKLQTIAPLHISSTLSDLRLLKAVLPKATFYGVSDSAFMATKPEVATYYGLPIEDANKLDIKRFGYHGLSFSSVVHQLKKTHQLPQRTVVCHLGGGVSISAIKNGRVVDSSMGYSPLEGVMMATRSGNIDLLASDLIKRHYKLDNDTTYDYFNLRSGLIGVSGVSSDIRKLLTLEHSQKRVKLALDMYVYKAQQAIGAMAVSMNGADALVFTGTVGLRSGIIRRRIVERLLHLGFMINPATNKHLDFVDGVADITHNKNPARILVIESNEDDSIIKQVNKMLS